MNTVDTTLHYLVPACELRLYLSAKARNPNPDEERTNEPYHQSYNIICATATAAAAAAITTVHSSQGLKASQQCNYIALVL